MVCYVILNIGHAGIMAFTANHYMEIHLQYTFVWKVADSHSKSGRRRFFCGREGSSVYICNDIYVTNLLPLLIWFRFLSLQVWDMYLSSVSSTCRDATIHVRTLPRETFSTLFPRGYCNWFERGASLFPFSKIKGW